MKVDKNNSFIDQERRYWRLRFELVKDSLDISNLPSDHHLYIYNADRIDKLLEYRDKNFKKLGLFKSEIPLESDTVSAMLALRPKLYSVAQIGDIVNVETTTTTTTTTTARVKKEIKKAKGISRSVIADTMTFDHYMSVYKNENTLFTFNHTFKTKLHQIYLTCINKNSICLSDMKRLWVNKLESLPFDYPLTEEQKLIIFGHRDALPSSSSSSSSSSS